MKQQSVEKVADAEVEVDEQAVVQSEFEAQTKTCATCPLFQPFNDGTGRGVCCGTPDTSLVVRDHHPLTQDCLHLIEFANATDAQVTSTQNPIPGYDFCVNQSIEFKQQTGSETGATYWYAVASHYYNQPSRQYKTGGFEKLENCVKAAVDYLGKCGVDIAEVKQQLIDYLRYGSALTTKEPEITQKQPPVAQKLESPAVGDKILYKVCYDDFTRQIALGEDANWIWCAAIVTKTYQKTVDLEFKLPEREELFTAKKVKISRLRRSVTDSYWNTVYDGYEAEALEHSSAQNLKSKICGESANCQSFQSGELFFTPINGYVTTYEVKHWSEKIGEISMNSDLMWEATGIDSIHPTPYLAAAALLEVQIKKADPSAAVSSLKSDEVVSKPIAELDHNQCEGLCQEEIPEIEIDSESDPDFGDLYRVWNGVTLLGTFFQGVADNKWIAQMVNDEGRHYCDTEFEAQLLIVAKSGLLVADVVEVDDLSTLLDKSFDELTPDEWQRLKQYKFDSENLAAA